MSILSDLSPEEMSRISDIMNNAEKKDEEMTKGFGAELTLAFGFDDRDKFFKDNLIAIAELVKSPTLDTLLDLLEKLGRDETLVAADTADTFRSVIIGRAAAYFDLKEKLLRLKRKCEEY